ncbi:MAG: CDGSH iron-sulfur domain-containing protein, partial [Candidatus Dormibacteraeota bacterium]|nr:CDGSH iron-sulfur domain-containing protein [Candidatus Dormibacteraeota bacterium]
MKTTDVALPEELRSAVAEAEELVTSLGRLSVAAGAAGGATLSLQRRIRHHVVRPLRAALDRLGPPSDHGTATAAAAQQDDDTEPRLWALAQRVAGLLTRPNAPFEVVLAAATLEDIASRPGLNSEAAPDAGRVAALRALHDALPASIVPAANGPLVVTNVRNLSSWLGEPFPATPVIALCRCGASALKPRCDSACAENGFSDAKDPKRVPDKLDEYMGRHLVLNDNRGTCAHSGFCSDRLPAAFRVAAEPFVAIGGGRLDELIHVVRACPSGALAAALAAGPSVTDTARDPAIEVSRNGPYRVTGGIPLVDDRGDPVPRNQHASLEHYSLCRCGHSRNKPFCSGMHWYVDFVDPPISTEPTVFEWAGGLPAMRRLTRVFYERYVPEDDLLAPLLRDLAPDHAERMAAWYAEVFGGPGRDGGVPGAGMPATPGPGAPNPAPFSEAQRERWVDLMERAADVASLPPEPEFRSTLSAFFDWTSRVNAGSRPGVEPIGQTPVPSWGWGPAGAPQLAATASEPAAEVAIPDASTPVSFAEHIRALFREKDRASMLFAFDLWAYADVAANAD